jgi:hypothetical protein
MNCREKHPKGEAGKIAMAVQFALLGEKLIIEIKTYPANPTLYWKRALLSNTALEEFLIG